MNKYSKICIFAFLMVFIMLASSVAVFASSEECVLKGQIGIEIADLAVAMSAPVVFNSIANNTTVSAAVYTYTTHITYGNVPANIDQGTRRYFTAQVRNMGVVVPNRTIIWTSAATSGGNAVPNAGNWINTNGVLDVPANAPVGAVITVTATSANANTTSVTLTVVAASPTTVTFNLGQNMTVTVDGQQRNNINSFTRSATIGNTFGTLPTITRNNYTLAAWFIGGDINDRFTANSRVDRNMSVSALWNPTGTTRTITFNPNGGRWVYGPWPGNLNSSGGGTANRQIDVGNNRSLASRGFSGTARVAFENFNMIPTRSGYNFDGWERDNGNTLSINDTFSSNVTVTARWVPINAITLTFNPQGGTWSGGAVSGTGNRTYQLPRHSSFSSEYGSGGLANRVGTVSRSGYRFDGWVIGNTTNSFTNTTVVNPSGNATTMTINATWTRITQPPPGGGQQPPGGGQQPPGGGQQPPGDGQQPPGGGQQPSVQFRDVPANAWFVHYVNTVVTRNLFQGMGDGIFAPNESMTRAMFVQVIYNMAGQPATATTNAFGDVPSNAWFAQAVSWASDQGIVHGVGPNRFAPNEPITREQMAAMLLRYAESRNVSLPAGTPITFADQASISPWARSSVNAVSAAGIVSGRAGNNFAPQATATRAEVAAIFARYLQVTGQ